MQGFFDPHSQLICFFLSTVVLGIALSLVYVFRCWRRLNTYSETVLINIFLRAGGFVSGLLLMLNTVHDVITSTYTPFPLPAFIGGAITAAYCAKGLYCDVFGKSYRPFTAYCRLRELCEVDATASLVWLDPFLDSSVFHRYLNGTRPHVPVTLVTSEPGFHAGKRDKARWAEFLDVSRLYAQERGSFLYRLVMQSNLHDRWVVFDGKRIYALCSLGKDAGNLDYFTITSVEASPTNFQSIQAHIDKGTELFGPSTPIHQ